MIEKNSRPLSSSWSQSHPVRPLSRAWVTCASNLTKPVQPHCVLSPWHWPSGHHRTCPATPTQAHAVWPFLLKQWGLRAPLWPHYTPNSQLFHLRAWPVLALYLSGSSSLPHLICGICCYLHSRLKFGFQNCIGNSTFCVRTLTSPKSPHLIPWCLGLFLVSVWASSPVSAPCLNLVRPSPWGGGSLGSPVHQNRSICDPPHWLSPDSKYHAFPLACVKL